MYLENIAFAKEIEENKNMKILINVGTNIQNARKSACPVTMRYKKSIRVKNVVIGIP